MQCTVDERRPFDPDDRSDRPPRPPARSDDPDSSRWRAITASAPAPDVRRNSSASPRNVVTALEAEAAWPSDRAAWDSCRLAGRRSTATSPRRRPGRADLPRTTSSAEASSSPMARGSASNHVFGGRELGQLVVGASISAANAAIRRARAGAGARRPRAGGCRRLRLAATGPEPGRFDLLGGMLAMGADVSTIVRTAAVPLPETAQYRPSGEGVPDPVGRHVGGE